MQPTPPAAPNPPAAPRPPDAAVSVDLAPTVATDGIVLTDAPVAGARALPRTTREIAGLRRQRSELSDQLGSAQDRRRDVARALERSQDPAVRAGLEQRLGVLDRRIAQIEGDIAETGRLITSAPPELLASSTTEPAGGFLLLGPNGPSANAAPALLLVVILLQIVLLARTRLRRRGPASDDPALRESAARLARLEQAVDAIAVEVERVSEGQRFVTRLLADERAPAARRQLADDGVPR